MLNESGNVNDDVGSSCSFRGRKGRREEYGEQLEKTREERKLVSPSGRCARLTRTVKSPPAPFSTALAIRIERQCQGQGRPSPPCRRILSLSSLILLLSSCSVERTEHACVPPSFLRPALDRWEFGWRQPSKPRNANSSYLAIRIHEYPRVFLNFWKVRENINEKFDSIRLVIVYRWKERGSDRLIWERMLFSYILIPNKDLNLN